MRILGLPFEYAVQIENESQLQNLIRFSYLPGQGDIIDFQQGVQPLPDHMFDFLRIDLLNS